MSEAVSLADFSAQNIYSGMIRSLQEGSFSHASLITGPDGVGKRTLSELLTAWLLCEREGGEKPCGTCAACVQALRGTHPDVITLMAGAPIAEGVAKGRVFIPVDDIREMTRQVSRHTYEGGRRVVRIVQAERMQAAAQNALLKTLEEPPEGTFFLLITETPELLLPTIRSRCRQLRLHGWPEAYVSQTLLSRGVPPERVGNAVRLSDGSIGRAMSLAGDESYWELRRRVMDSFFGMSRNSDIPSVSQSWKELKGDQAVELLDVLEDMTRTLLLCRLGRLPASQLEAFPEDWQRIAEKAPLESFAAIMNTLSEARLMKQSNVTWQAVVEQILFCLMEEKRKWSMS
ncbi:MAG: DNA polymerase III subunit delta' [Clostridia bacterium]|nr:DNA polymerase III subunit delta' [Clostridia bacterium]